MNSMVAAQQTHARARQMIKVHMVKVAGQEQQRAAEFFATPKNPSWWLGGLGLVACTRSVLESLVLRDEAPPPERRVLQARNTNIEGSVVDDENKNNENEGADESLQEQQRARPKDPVEQRRMLEEDLLRWRLRDNHGVHHHNPMLQVATAASPPSLQSLANPNLTVPSSPGSAEYLYVAQ